MFKILIADDHLPVRVGMRGLMEDILGNCSFDFAASGNEIFSLLSQNLYDIFVTDLTMPQVESLQIVPRALALQPQLKILVMSVHPERIFARRLLMAGAYGYLQKDAPDTDIENAIRNISAGRKYISSTQMEDIGNLLATGATGSVFDHLSPRELEVAVLLLKGFGPLEIANALTISPSTASSFKARVFKKLNVSNTMDMSRLAALYGLKGSDLVL